MPGETAYTNVRIAMSEWRWLNAQKEPGDSFSDAMRRVRDEFEAQEDELEALREHVDDDELPAEVIA